jgi:hypothetical protein
MVLADPLQQSRGIFLGVYREPVKSQRICDTIDLKSECHSDIHGSFQTYLFERYQAIAICTNLKSFDPIRRYRVSKKF